MQFGSSMLATGELEFSGQLRQAEFPSTILYVFTGQFVHAPPLFPVHPTMQWQLVSAVLTGNELLFAGQLSQD